MNSRRRLACASFVMVFLSLASAAAATALSDADRTARPVPVVDPDGLARLRGSTEIPDRIPADLLTATTRQSVFVQFSGQGAAAVAEQALPAGARGTAAETGQDAARVRRAEIATQSRVTLRAARQVDDRASRQFTVTNGVPGAAMRLDARGIAALAARTDVVRVSRLVPKSIDNAGAAALLKAVDTWSATGTTGRGVRIGIIDGGLDFTHADFGGPGTVAAYEQADADDTSATWRDGLTPLARAKVAGGYDFAGDDYAIDPDPTKSQSTPHPDPDPLDCIGTGRNAGHGSHVAGTAAGYGVSADGRTYTDSYAALDATSLRALRIGPGMAPRARLYPLRVFGCTGGTELVMPALDWAMDPNADGDFSDHLDIVNLSLGGASGIADDPETAMVDAASAAGVLVVAAIGNNGDLTDVGDSPAVARSSLAVAAADDSLTVTDGLRVIEPTGASRTLPAQFSKLWPWASAQPVSGRVALLSSDNRDGCAPLSSADREAVAGRVVWLTWDDTASRRCGSVTRSTNLLSAGAIGLILASGLEIFSEPIDGSVDLPVVRLPSPGSEELAAAAAAGTLQVTLDGSLQGTGQILRLQDAGVLAPWSSRGSHSGSGGVKPDVTGAGVSIASAAAGTGDRLSVRAGTSMASPSVAGIAALVKQRHPAWGPLQLKAAVMNTASQDAFAGEDHTGTPYPPARAGSGIVDALAATRTSLLAWTLGPSMPVSATFPVVAAPINRERVERRRTVVVVNRSNRPVTVDLAYQAVNAAAGVTFEISPATMTVPALGRATAQVRLIVRPSELRHTIDPTMAPTQATPWGQLARQFVSDASGRILVTPRRGGTPLRVPVYAAAKPASTTTAVATATGIALRGSGVAQGSGATAYTSLASVLQLGTTSAQLPACTEVQIANCTATSADRAADLAAVGAGSTADWLWFGIAMQAPGSTIGRNVIPFVSYDVDGDGRDDYRTQVQPWTGTDVYTAVTFDLRTGTDVLADVQPVNFRFGDVDTNVFDTDVVLAPVSRARLSGLPTTGPAPISYTVGTYNALTSQQVDVAGPVTYDIATPGVVTDEPVYQDEGGVVLPVVGTSGAYALVLHLHGQPGRRAELVQLP